MKSLVRNTTFYAFSLYMLSLLLQGVKIQGGLTTLLLGGLTLSILFAVLKPVLSLISLPLNLITLGLFSFFINSIILYITTVIIPGISISAFTFPGFSWAGFVIPSYSFNSLFAYVVAAGFLALFMNFFSWLIRK